MTDFDEIVARAKRTSFRAGIASLIGLAIVVFALAYGTLQVRLLRSEIASLRTTRVSIEGDVGRLTDQKNQLIAQNNRLTDQKNRLQQQVNELWPKLEVAQLAVAAASKARSATIQYFPKDADGKRVEAALTGLGFVVIPPGRGNPALRKSETNAIFFGPAVKLDDLKLVAVALVKGGVGLRVIRPIQRPGRGKANLIEIGATGHPGDSPVFTAARIQSAKTVADFS